MESDGVVDGGAILLPRELIGRQPNLVSRASWEDWVPGRREILNAKIEEVVLLGISVGGEWPDDDWECGGDARVL